MPERHRPPSEIERALHTGPFSEALRTAIDRSGLSLNRISSKLDERGVRVSAAALSYWQRGSNRPERADSLRAVGLLEEILDLAPNTLMTLLGPRRSRGRWSAPSTPLPTGALWTDSSDLDRTLSGLEKDAPRSLWAVSTVYTHLRERVATDRTLGETRIRKVVRAETDGVDRIIAVTHTDGSPTRFEAVHAARLGRVRTDPGTGYSVAEFILDRMLNTGDTATVEYVSYTATPQGPPQNYTRHSLYRPAAVLVLEVEFDAKAIPARCAGFYSPRRGTPEQSLGPLWIGNSNSAHLALSDLDAGMYGIRWEWD
ncbi:hypothetical protein K7472_19770 [Streptomyces sp. PTM05]|uniref:Transcriptional regulator n=1 Tax=Streptantibioticus parmotrematis TaxID=2873249 RepID=A0ABS7QV36_9ACTN|nr:hypothetical protein [Streptantibioticus parmotrematis]MBY8887067.1 hypothetical protein [Streptantibioticus parmotrematis]